MRRVAIGTAAGLLAVGGALGISAAAAGLESGPDQSRAVYVVSSGDTSQLRATTSAAPGTTLAGAAIGFLVLGAGAASVAARRR
jgi:hypothetical protein